MINWRKVDPKNPPPGGTDYLFYCQGRVYTGFPTHHRDNTGFPMWAEAENDGSLFAGVQYYANWNRPPVEITDERTALAHAIADWKPNVSIGMVDSVVETLHAMGYIISKELPEQLRGVREPVLRYAVALEGFLKDSYWKGGWHDCEPTAFMYRLTEATVDLEDSLANAQFDQAEEEAIYVGAYAMMIHDILRLIPKPEED